MKNLNEKEFKEAPNSIQLLYCKSIANYPVGSEELKKAIEEFPDYFPEEIEHQRKWKSIPEIIHAE